MNITRRQFSKGSLAAGAGLIGSVLLADKLYAETAAVNNGKTKGGPKYNVVVIKTDQQRADTINFLGSKFMITPNMDKLARRSVVFSNAFCCGATCVVSRAAFYTGRFTINTGVYTFQNWDQQPTWLDDFKKSGYHLAAIGKNHHMPMDAPMAFDERVIVENFPLYEKWDDFSSYLEANNQPRPLELLTGDGKWLDKCGSDVYPLDEKYYVDTFVGDNAVNWINKYDKAEPFFLHIGFQGPHDPFTVPKRFLDMYDDVEVPAPVDGDGGENKPPQYERFRRTVAEPVQGFDKPPIYGASYIDLKGKTAKDIERMRKHYYAKITAADEQIGRIMDALDAKGLTGNTIIVFTSDHGENLGDHNLVYKWLMTEQTVKVPMMISLPKKLQRAAIDERLFSQIDVGPTLLDMCHIKPTVTLDGCSNKERVLEGSDKNVPQEVFCFQNYLTMIRTDSEKLINYSQQSYGEYYDLEKDPSESHNLYDTQKDKVNRLKGRLFDWFSASRFLGTPQDFSNSVSDKITRKPRLYPENYPKDPYRMH